LFEVEIPTHCSGKRKKMKKKIETREAWDEHGAVVGGALSSLSSTAHMSICAHAYA